MLRLILVVGAGAAAGGLLGYLGQCSTGACPLLATWWRGAIWGGALALLAYVTATSN